MIVVWKMRKVTRERDGSLLGDEGLEVTHVADHSRARVLPQQPDGHEQWLSGRSVVRERRTQRVLPQLGRR